MICRNDMQEHHHEEEFAEFPLGSFLVVGVSGWVVFFLVAWFLFG